MAALVALALACPAVRADSLVRNGSFEEADKEDKTRPAHWDRPDGLGVQWVKLPRDKSGAGHDMVIRMDTAVSEKDMVAQWKKTGITKWDIPRPSKGSVAATYGLSYYSEAIPVESGQAYRVSFDFKGPSGGAKVWVRGYGTIRGERRRLYETIVNCRVENKEWKRFSQVFHPTKHRSKVTEMKVMLYAYWPAGVYWFDNVTIGPVTPEE